MELFDQIEEAAAFIRTRTALTPQFGIILGTGLGGLTEDVAVDTEINYADIPHFARSTVESHQGKMIFGQLSGKTVVVMAGRFHYYEGWTMRQVTFPVRVMKRLGIQRLIITNVSGGVNPHLRAGDLVVVKDHINLLPENPLRGENDERLGPRFPDLLNMYDPEMRQKALKIAQRRNIRAVEGVYSALQGPNLETPAEYDMLHRLGSDCTGMSSVPEALVAKHMSVPVLMISLVSNVSYPPSAIRVTTLEEVVAVAQKSEPGLRSVVRELIGELVP